MDYYSECLSGERLRKCYSLASPRVRQYLASEIQIVLNLIETDNLVLELGCGYGRVTFPLARKARHVVGIDTSAESLSLAESLSEADSNCEFHLMDACDLQFPDAKFDVVVCVQNGVCAFGVDKIRLLKEALRVTRPVGRVLFSSYSAKFWSHRLKWFESQARHGLLGAIDYERTRNGVIVCRDGFRAGSLTRVDFESLCSQFGVQPDVWEVDDSSLFCVIRKEEVGQWSTVV